MINGQTKMEIDEEIRLSIVIGHPLCEYNRTNQFGVSAHRSHRLGRLSHGGWAA
jgi:hypothetical protein